MAAAPLSAKDLVRTLDCFQVKLSRQESNPGRLACAASALPLSCNNQTTTSPLYAEAASPVRLVRPRPDHFSAVCWSEDETTGSGVPRKLVFALHVRVSRNRSRSFIPPPRASRNASGASLRLPRVLHFRASPPTVHMYERSFFLQWPDHFSNAGAASGMYCTDDTEMP